MKVYGICAYDIDTVVREVSRARYDGNVGLKSLADCSNSKGPRATFTLRTLDSTAGRPGAMGNPRQTGTGPNGTRRSISACWHAHWDVIEALLERYPDAQVVSGFVMREVVVRYTRDTFRKVALATAHLNMGSATDPFTRPQCCECDHSRYSDVSPYPDLSLTPYQLRALQALQQARLRDPLAPENEPEPDLSGYEHNHREDGTPDSRCSYLAGLPAALPWKPDERHAVVPGSGTVGNTLDKITELVGE
jgi:hypothetical protein